MDTIRKIETKVEDGAVLSRESVFMHPSFDLFKEEAITTAYAKANTFGGVVNIEESEYMLLLKWGDLNASCIQDAYFNININK